MPRLGNTSSYPKRVATIFTQALNVVILNGHPGESTSARAHRTGLWIEPWIDVLFYALTFGRDQEHCRAAHDSDKAFARTLLELDDTQAGGGN